MKRYILLFFTILLSISACSAEREIANYDDELGDLQLKTNQYGNLDLKEAVLSGAIGEIRDIAGSTLVNGLDQNGYTTIEVLSENNEGIAMHWLEFYGGINHKDLVPGEHLSFKDGEFPDDPEALHVQVMGCEGKEVYNWNLDEPASEVEIDVLEGPVEDSVKLEYTVTVPNTLNFAPQAEDESKGTFIIYKNKTVVE